MGLGFRVWGFGSGVWVSGIGSQKSKHASQRYVEQWVVLFVALGPWFCILVRSGQSFRG